MTLTLRAAITDGDTVFDVLGADDLQPGEWKTIDSEAMTIRTAKAATLAYGEAARYRVSVYRGSAGTHAAAHDAGATVTAYSAGGSGLPSQWTDGGHGDVTATTDDGSVPLTVDGPVTVNPRADDLYGILIEAAAGFYDAYNAFLRVIDENGVQIFNIDQGGFDMKAPAGQGLTHVQFSETDTSYTASLSSRSLTLGTAAGGTAFNIGEASGIQLFAFVPIDSPGGSRVQMYYDDTIGAAKIRFRGKDADGTVVTGSVNLT